MDQSTIKADQERAKRDQEEREKEFLAKYLKKLMSFKYEENEGWDI